MAETLGTSRKDISTFAPRIITIKIPVEKIRDVIGPGGKVIRSIVERITGLRVAVMTAVDVLRVVLTPRWSGR
jgi:polyribonucleotide nucleotidyltransferase